MDVQGTLDLESHWEFYRRFGFLQRLGWAAIGALLIAALAGLFGRGFAGRMEQQDGPLAVRWDRFGRVQSPLKFEFALEPESVEDGKVKLWISRAWLGHFTINSIEPEPEAVEVAGERLVYTFRAEPDTRATIVYHMSADELVVGCVQGEAGTPRGDHVELTQWIWP